MTADLNEIKTKRKKINFRIFYRKFFSVHLSLQLATSTSIWQRTGILDLIMQWPFLVLVLLIGLSSEAPQSFVFQFYQLGYSMENEEQVRKLRFSHSKGAWPDPGTVTFQGPRQRSVNFEMSFWCLQIDQKTNEIFVRISALASKKEVE